MHRLPVALTVVLLLFNIAGAQQKSARDKATLHGAVRSVRTTKTDYRDETLKQPIGTPVVASVTYDKRGNELENIGGYFGSKEVHTYDAEGNLIESVFSEPTGIFERQVYAYKNGKLISTVGYDADQKVTSRQLNLYDKNSRLIEEKYFAGTTALGKTVFQYDPADNVSEAAFFLPNGAKSIAVSGPCVGPGAHRITYFYDEQRRLIKLVSYQPNGQVNHTEQYSYNSKGEISEHKLTKGSTRQSTVHAYEYDSNGNWTRRMSTLSFESNDSQPDPFTKKFTVTSREISYY